MQRETATDTTKSEFVLQVCGADVQDVPSHSKNKKSLETVH
jgi:hypothetical protein